jgi:hypothetical protein
MVHQNHEKEKNRKFFDLKLVHENIDGKKTRSGFGFRKVRSILRWRRNEGSSTIQVTDRSTKAGEPQVLRVQSSSSEP